MQSIEDMFLLKTCKIRFFVIILPSAFQAERMFPLPHIRQNTKRMNPHGFILFFILCIVTTSVMEAGQCRS